MLRIIVIGVVCVCTWLQVSFAKDILAQIGESLSKVEKWSEKKKFVWNVNVLVRFEMNKIAYKNLQAQVAKRGGTLLERSYEYDSQFKFTVARNANHLVIDGKATNGRVDTPFFLYIDKGMYVVGTHPVYATPADSKPEWISEAYVFSTERDLMHDYLFPQPFLFTEPGYEFFYGLLAYISPLRFFSEQPKVASQRSAYLISGRGTLLGRAINLLVDANASIVELSSSTIAGAFKKHIKYSFSDFQNLEDVRFYRTLRFEKTESSPEQKRSVHITFKLERIDMLENEELSPVLPHGCLVSDFRRISREWEVQDYSKFFTNPKWEKVTRYSWQGSLPDEKQLEKLAYQQGNLLPPETPRRRYSLWMFLPAIALFGLALLLYLRRRRL